MTHRAASSELLGDAVRAARVVGLYVGAEPVPRGVCDRDRLPRCRTALQPSNDSRRRRSSRLSGEVARP
jgi:hypothetical protein